jgi:hypothetical protein
MAASLFIIIIILCLVLYFNNLSRKEKEESYQKEMIKMERENRGLLHLSEEERKFKLGVKTLEDKIDLLLTKNIILRRNKSILELMRSEEYKELQDEIDKLLKEKEEYTNSYYNNRIKD